MRTLGSGFVGRSKRGGTIADFAPAMFILFVIITFPLIDLLCVALVYNAASILNTNQAREAALEPFSEARDNPAGMVQKTLVDNWKNNGIGKFCKIQGDPQTTVRYKTGSAGDKLVEVTTAVVVSPLVPVPFFVGVPGLNAPVPLQFTTQRVVENPDNAPPGV